MPVPFLAGDGEKTELSQTGITLAAALLDNIVKLKDGARTTFTQEIEKKWSSVPRLPLLVSAAIKRLTKQDGPTTMKEKIDGLFQALLRVP